MQDLSRVARFRRSIMIRPGCGPGMEASFTSRANEIVGDRLHSPARNRFPQSTARPSKATFSAVVGVKSCGTRTSARPGTKPLDLSEVCSLRVQSERSGLIVEGAGRFLGLGLGFSEMFWKEKKFSSWWVFDCSTLLMKNEECEVSKLMIRQWKAFCCL